MLHKLFREVASGRKRMEAVYLKGLQPQNVSSNPAFFSIIQQGANAEKLDNK